MSRLWEMLRLVAAVSLGYLSLAANVCAGSPCHEPAAGELGAPSSHPQP